MGLTSATTTTWPATVAGSTTPCTTSWSPATSTLRTLTPTSLARPGPTAPVPPTPPTLSVASAPAVPPRKSPSPTSRPPWPRSAPSALPSTLAVLASSCTLAASTPALPALLLLSTTPSCALVMALTLLALLTGLLRTLGVPAGVTTVTSL